MKRAARQRIRLQTAKRQRRRRLRAGKGMRAFRLVLNEHDVVAMLLRDGRLGEGDALEFQTLERAMERLFTELFQVSVTRDCSLPRGSSILRADESTAAYAVVKHLK